MHRRLTVAALSMERVRGTGPAYVKIGRRVLYPISAVREFERQCRVVPVNSAARASA